MQGRRDECDHSASPPARCSLAVLARSFPRPPDACAPNLLRPAPPPCCTAATATAPPQSYIDFEIGEGDRERVRVLYTRLLDRTKHVKVGGDMPIGPSARGAACTLAAA